VKTRIQAQPRRYSSMNQAALEILKEDGPGALLGGLGPTVIGYGIEGAMKFGVYEVLKPVFAALLVEHTGSDAHKGVAFLFASIVAGAVAALLLCPMESTRIKIVTDPSYKNDGLLSALARMIAADGFGSVFAGLWAMLAKQVPYTFGKQVSFDVFASKLYVTFRSLQEGGASWLGEREIKWAVSVCAAFLASLVACIMSQPGDMILTETYSKDKPTSFKQVIKNINGSGGLANFFTGTSARIVHVGVIITSQLIIYDIVKQALGLPATGAH
jgi:solute carrier family 25 phosphate transporter 3